MTNSAKIPPFEDIDVDRATVRITNAGDGLSEALRVQPKAFHMGEEVFFVLRGEVTQINHRTDRDESVTRVHTVKASDITEVDPLTAQRMLTAAAEDLEKRKAEMDGQGSLFRDDEAGFQGRSGVHPVRPDNDDAEDAEELAAALADEQAALDAEQLDETGTPSEIAEAALARVITPAFSNPPAVGD